MHKTHKFINIDPAQYSHNDDNESLRIARLTREQYAEMRAILIENIRALAKKHGGRVTLTKKDTRDETLKVRGTDGLDNDIWTPCGAGGLSNWRDLYNMFVYQNDLKRYNSNGIWG